MTNFEQARINMVDSQIHPMGVISEPVLNAFRTVPREKFVPADKQAVAYCDEDLPLGNGRWLMEPQVLARLVQASAPTPDDVVLIVGAGSGYEAAIYAALASRVIALEENGELAASAVRVWQEAGLSNIAVQERATEPCDLIVINGAVADVPDRLKSQMAVGGRLIAVVRPKPNAAGQATLILRTDDHHWSTRILFDANIPYLPGMAPKNSFVF